MTQTKREVKMSERRMVMGKKCTQKECCCKCKSLITDYHHCIVDNPKDGCCCSKVKGYICLADGTRAFSGWSRHGCCELFMARKEDKK